MSFSPPDIIQEGRFLRSFLLKIKPYNMTNEQFYNRIQIANQQALTAGHQAKRIENKYMRREKQYIYNDFVGDLSTMAVPLTATTAVMYAVKDRSYE